MVKDAFYCCFSADTARVIHAFGILQHHHSHAWIHGSRFTDHSGTASAGDRMRI